jgi:GntR family transcriptional regulator
MCSFSCSRVFAMTSSRLSDLPLHLSISEKIKRWIETGKYQPGDRLPSESQLMAQFEVSRITIRRALSNLGQQGLVISQRGKGVFVKEQRRAVYSLSSPFVWFNEDMLRQGLNNSIKTLVYKAIKPPEKVRKKLNLSSTAKVYLQEKFFVIDNIAAALDITYIVSDLGKAFATELKQRMTFPVLEEHGIVIERLEAMLSSRQADRQTADVLGLDLGSSLLVYEHTAYTCGDRPILCGETLSSGDRLAYSITLKK